MALNDIYEPFMHLNCPEDPEIWAVSPKGRAIISNKPLLGGVGNDAQNIGWYGGYLVCESISNELAQSIVDRFNREPD